MASIMRSSVASVLRTCVRRVGVQTRSRVVAAPRATATATVARRTMCSAQDFGSINEVLEREIELEKATAPEAVLEELSQRFSDFTVTANPGYGRVYLTKSLAGGEDVQVEIDVQNTVELREDPEGEEEGELEEHGELEEEENVMEGFPMIITVGRAEGGKQLKLSCVASHELVITSIRMAEPNPDADSDEMYQGPNFDDLDLSLQQAFYNYLEEVAGIDDTFSDNVREFCEAKEQVEYCNWLDEVHRFVTHEQ